MICRNVPTYDVSACVCVPLKPSMLFTMIIVMANFEGGNFRGFVVLCPTANVLQQLVEYVAIGIDY